MTIQDKTVFTLLPEGIFFRLCNTSRTCCLLSSLRHCPPLKEGTPSSSPGIEIASCQSADSPNSPPAFSISQTPGFFSRCWLGLRVIIFRLRREYNASWPAGGEGRGGLYRETDRTQMVGRTTVWTSRALRHRHHRHNSQDFLLCA